MQDVVQRDRGFFATYAVNSWSSFLARAAGRAGLGSDALVGTSAGLGLIAAAWFATGTRGGLIAGAFALLAALVIQEAARGVERTTRFATWLGVMAERAREVVVYAGLAIGYGGGPDTWLLAFAATILLATRDMIEFSYQGDPLSGEGWIRQILTLPDGERTLLICAAAAVFNARITFLALLGWGSVAVCYSLARRIRRSLKG